MKIKRYSLFIFIFSLFTNGSFAQQKLTDSGFTNKAEAKNLTINGKKEGKWLEYMDSIWTVTYPFSDGKLEGVVIEYYENGKIKSTTIFKNGIKGEIKNYDENGNEIK